jgi:hypothetical protein
MGRGLFFTKNMVIMCSLIFLQQRLGTLVLLHAS